MTSNDERKKQDSIDWRRSMVLQLTSQGCTQREIAQTLQVSNGTVNSDLSHLRKAAKENIRSYIDEKIPWEYEKCLTTLEAINKKAWEISESTENTREKLHALSLAKECVTTKLDLITNSTIIGEAISFIERSKDRLKHLSNNSSAWLSEKEESKPNATIRIL
ncbi:MAG: LuxR C-terminal-related transcriptional regulator [Thermoproteota archaeon]|nr:LuxR C-terminal-related transcriptional regulator [Thermoproteota archaeon]